MRSVSPIHLEYLRNMGVAASMSISILVGDRLDADIAPAKARAMATIQFRSGRWRKQRPRSAVETPDMVVTDVGELEAAIADLLAR